jgi:hypothetical protein
MAAMADNRGVLGMVPPMVVDRMWGLDTGYVDT